MLRVFKKKKAKPENAIMRYAFQALSLHKDIFFYRNNTGAYKTESGAYVKYGYAGSSDILAFHNGKVLFLELKATEDKKLNDNQENFKNKVEAVGCLYIKAGSPEQIDKAIEKLKSL